MGMKYQKGTVYPSGKRVKTWYGQYLVYRKDQNGKEVRRQRNVRICPKANTPKWKAEQMLQEIILKESKGLGPTPTLPPDDSVTFRWFVKQRYIPMRQGGWSPAYKKTNTYQLEHYLVSHFGDLPLRNLSTFEIQVWLNGLAEKGYSGSVVRQCFSNIRAITHMARKQKYLAEDPGEDVTMPLFDSADKPVMTREQILALLGAIEDMHDLCLMYVAIFCGPRASEVLGFQWKSWTGSSLMPYGTAYEGKFYRGRLKTKASKAAIPVPELVRPVIEAWRRICSDASPEALMFPTFGRGRATGAGGAAFEQELSRMAHSPHLPETRHPGSPRHLPGVAADAGNRYAEARDAQRHTEHPAPCQHPDNWGRVRSENRSERSRCRELAHLSSTRKPEGSD